MRILSEQHHADGLAEHELTLGDIRGVLWARAPGPTPAPLVLLGHPGDLDRMRPRLLARARRSAADGLASATIELPVPVTDPASLRSIRPGRTCAER